MEPLETIESPAVPLALANVDTDQLIPARFMKRPRSAGYGDYLLYDLRNDPAGSVKGNRLDDPRHAGAAVIVARRNFGCGSSREAAVYALQDYGVRCVIAPSFGDIFASNAVKNGVLPARVTDADAEALLASPTILDGHPVRVDLLAETVTAGNLVIPFAIDAIWKKQLLNGWDDIDFTIAEQPAIERFRTSDAIARPWAAPQA